MWTYCVQVKCGTGKLPHGSVSLAFREKLHLQWNPAEKTKWRGWHEYNVCTSVCLKKIVNSWCHRLYWLLFNLYNSWCVSPQMSKKSTNMLLIVLLTCHVLFSLKTVGSSTTKTAVCSLDHSNRCIPTLVVIFNMKFSSFKSCLKNFHAAAIWINCRLLKD